MYFEARDCFIEKHHSLFLQVGKEKQGEYVMWPRTGRRTAEEQGLGQK